MRRSIRWGISWRRRFPPPASRSVRRPPSGRPAQQVTGQSVELAYVDQGYTGEEPAEAAATQGIQLEVVRLPDANGPKQGRTGAFVLFPRRWVVEHSFALLACFRRLARDYERLPRTVAGLTILAFTCLMLHLLIRLPRSS